LSLFKLEKEDIKFKFAINKKDFYINGNITLRKLSKQSSNLFSYYNFCYFIIKFHVVIVISNGQRT